MTGILIYCEKKKNTIITAIIFSIHSIIFKDAVKCLSKRDYRKFNGHDTVISILHYGNDRRTARIVVVRLDDKSV